MKNLSNQRIHLWREETGYFLPIRPLHVLPRVSPESLLSRLAKNNKFCRLISESKRIKIVFCIYCFKKTSTIIFISFCLFLETPNFAISHRKSQIFLRFVKSKAKQSVANKSLVVVVISVLWGPPAGLIHLVALRALLVPNHRHPSWAL